MSISEKMKVEITPFCSKFSCILNGDHRSLGYSLNLYLHSQFSISWFEIPSWKIEFQSNLVVSKFPQNVKRISLGEITDWGNYFQFALKFCSIYIWVFGTCSTIHNLWRVILDLLMDLPAEYSSVFWILMEMPCDFIRRCCPL